MVNDEQPEIVSKRPTRLSDAFAGAAPASIAERLGLAAGRKSELLETIARSGAAKASVVDGLAAYARVEALGKQAARDLDLVLPKIPPATDYGSISADLARAAANSPAARTANATREIADRLATSQADLAEYQRVVKELVEQLHAEAAEDRRRAVKAEAATASSLRIARWGPAFGAVGVLGVAATIAALFIR